MSGTMGMIVGFAVAGVLLSVLLVVVVRRTRHLSTAELVRLERLVTELRYERFEDKETNRRLRHELHEARAALPSTDDPYGLAVNLDPDTAHMEREDALRKLAETQRQLDSVRSRLADREAKLRDYRDALKEIRISLEAQDRLSRLVSFTDDLSMTSPAMVEPVVERLGD